MQPAALVAVSRDLVRQQNRLLQISQEIRRAVDPRLKHVTNAWHQRMALEAKWSKALGPWQDHLLHHLDIEAAYAEAKRGWQPIGKRRWIILKAEGEGYAPPDNAAVNARLIAQINEAAMLTGAMQVYLQLAAETSAVAGQTALEHLGMNETWAWAHPQNMARDLFGVRGSKVVQGLYGAHIDQLQRMIVAATDPRHPKTIAQVKAEINESWPGMKSYQADRIARTETATLWTATSMNAYAANGITQFESIIATGPSVGVESEDPCDECISAAAEVHTMEDDIPPWHPNCRCEAVPVLEDEDGTPWLPPDEPFTGAQDMAIEGSDEALAAAQEGLPVMRPAPGPGEAWRPPATADIAPMVEQLEAQAVDEVVGLNPELDFADVGLGESWADDPAYALAQRMTNEFESSYKANLRATDFAAIDTYRGEEFVQTNAFARYGSDAATRPEMVTRFSTVAENMDAARVAVERLDAAITRVPGLSKETTLFRGVSDWEKVFGMPLEQAIGDQAIFTDDAFVSMSNEPSLARMFGGATGGVMRITVPQGTRGIWCEASDLAQHGRQWVTDAYVDDQSSMFFEWIGQRGMSFRVTGIDAKGIVEVEALPQTVVAEEVQTEAQLLADKDQAMLRHYRMGNFYRANAKLRGGKALDEFGGASGGFGFGGETRGITEVEQTWVDTFDRLIAGQTAPEDMTVWRGTHATPEELFGGTPHVGDTFTDQGFVATTTNPDIIVDFDSGAAFQIEVPRGTNILDVEATGTELDYSQSEFVLPRGTRFRVTKIDPDGLIHMRIDNMAVAGAGDEATTASLRAEITSLNNKLSGLKTRLKREASKLGSDPSKYAEISGRINELEGQRLELKTRLQAKGSDAPGLPRAKPEPAPGAKPSAVKIGRAEMLSRDTVRSALKGVSDDTPIDGSAHAWYYGGMSAEVEAYQSDRLWKVWKHGDTVVRYETSLADTAETATTGGVSPADVANIRLRDATEKQVVKDALDTIGEVIRLPEDAPKVDIKRGTGSTSFAAHYDTPTIQGAFYSDREQSSLVHEFGHYMDWVMGGKSQEMQGRYVRSAVTRPVVEREADVQKLLSALADAPEYETLRATDEAHYKYLRRGDEQFARSFEQYIGTKTGNQAILDKIATTRRVEEAAKYWSEESFRPILAAWDDFLGGRGWLREASGPGFLETAAAEAEVEKAISQVAKLLDELPANLKGKDKLESLVVARGRSPADAFWGKQYNTDNFRCAAQGGYGEITYWTGGGGRLETQSVFDHEMGHIIGLDSGPLNPAEWKRAVEADKAYAKTNIRDQIYGGGSHDLRIGGDGVTSYGSNSEKEDWAESVRLWLHNDREGYIGVTSSDGERMTYRDLFPNRAKLVDHWAFGAADPGPIIVPVENVGLVGDTAARVKQIGNQLSGVRTRLKAEERTSGMYTTKWYELWERERSLVSERDELRQALPVEAVDIPAPISGPAGAAAERVLAKQELAIRGPQATALSEYVDGSHGINAYARQGTDQFGHKLEPWKRDRLKKITQQMDAAFEGAATPGNVTVYRGVGDVERVFGTSNLDTLVGTEFQDNGYFSTTTSKEATDYFRGSSGVAIEVTVPKGAPAIWMENLGSAVKQSGEHELLIARGSRYRITGVKRSLSKETILMEMLP